MSANGAPRAPERWLGAIYAVAQRWLTRMVLERRYHVPPHIARPVKYEESGARVLEDMGVRPDEWWPEEGERWGYQASRWGILRRILRADDVVPTDVFLDLGCGAGRVLLEAGVHYPFQRVVGVDVVPQLTDLAVEILARNKRRLRCRDVELVTEDMLDYEVPEDVTVVYLFEPVRGRSFEIILAKLIASVDRHPRRLRIIFMGSSASVVEGTGRVRLLRYGRGGLRRWREVPYLRLYEIVPAPVPGKSHGGGQ